MGRARADGSVGVVADVGHSIFADTAAAPAHVEEGAQAHARAGERDELLGEMRYATIQLRPGVDTVIIGSEGLWCASITLCATPLHAWCCHGYEGMPLCRRPSLTASFRSNFKAL